MLGFRQLSFNHIYEQLKRKERSFYLHQETGIKRVYLMFYCEPIGKLGEIVGRTVLCFKLACILTNRSVRGNHSSFV